MKIILSHISALRFWRSYRGPALARMTAAEQRAFLRAMSKEGSPGRHELELLRKMALPGLSEPFHLMVLSNRMRHACGGLAFHLSPDAFPENSLILLTSDVAVCSPEFAFVQYADQVKCPIQTAMLGFELCGTYRFDVAARKFNLKAGAPVSSVERIVEFLDSLGIVHGKKVAESAASMLVGGSASPMETSSTLLLCLPHKQGGYAVPFPCLNYEIVRQNGPDGNGRNSYRCDLCWPKEKICIEYDSDEYHGSLEQMTADAMKRAALNAMGYTVVEVTRAQIMNEEAFDEIAHALYAALGLRLRIRTSDFQKRRDILRQKILHSFSMYM